MAETPDFWKIAERWCYFEETDTVEDQKVRQGELREELIRIWNARGAADLATIESALLDDGDDSQMNKIDHALRALDR